MTKKASCGPHTYGFVLLCGIGACNFMVFDHFSYLLLYTHYSVILIILVKIISPLKLSADTMPLTSVRCTKYLSGFLIKRCLLHRNEPFFEIKKQKCALEEKIPLKKGKYLQDVSSVIMEILYQINFTML